MKVRRVIALLLPVLVLGCPGCATQSTSGQADPFSGPWGASLKQVRDESDNETVRKVLEDGVIDDAEQAQIESDMTQCMADLGYEWIYIDKGDGGEAVNPTERARGKTAQETRRHLDGCGKSTGFDPLLELARQIRNNPEHKDINELILECLQRKKLIDKSMTLDEYLYMLEDPAARYRVLGPYEDPAYPDYDPLQAGVFVQCTTSPQR
ncbi:hypothetical protein JS533_000585 [Bifidobacterium amazonense]|uniref:Lipoprotein n=1 Tax=Bifidobacterium amazonense TaxID=2809027 RepID=A0ABS9VS58_9BIFI|nr:hypothetical protein [Bifidobacterium amazonense]MCH9274791.1 hypothetical protein [Bifidobacterium amazonense]